MYRVNCIDFLDVDILIKFSIFRLFICSLIFKKNLDYYVYMFIIFINMCSNVFEIYFK